MQVRVIDRARDKRAVETILEDVIQQACSVSGRDRELDVGTGAGKPWQKRRQSQRGGRLEASDQQSAPRHTIIPCRSSGIRGKF